MLKNLLIKCASMSGREDLVSKIEQATSLADISSEFKNDVKLLIDCFNGVMSKTFEFYLELYTSENIVSNAEKQIVYSNFSKTPIRIESVEDENKNPVSNVIRCYYIEVPKANEKYVVNYRYIPKFIRDFSDDISYIDSRLETVFCYGIVSEFFASKGNYTESEFYEKKFLTSLFNLKTKKERRLKSTFSLWER